MILVDTSVWIDHLHSGEPVLIAALADDGVLCHPLVIEELALGRIRNRQDVLGLLSNLSSAPTLAHDEVMAFIEVQQLWGKGLNLVDAHLLGSAMLAPAAHLWTRDKGMRAAAEALRIPTIAA